MVRRVQSELDPMKSASCPNCGCKRLIYGGGKLRCSDCGHVIGKLSNKYHAVKTEFNGKIYDSKFEGSVAAELELMKRAGEIKDYETQYRIECWAHRADGTQAFKVRHKVDFRLHLNDGSYELLEAKGRETDDYKWRLKFLENIWLPDHPDHTYRVIKQSGRRY